MRLLESVLDCCVPATVLLLTDGALIEVSTCVDDEVSDAEPATELLCELVLGGTAGAFTSALEALPRLEPIDESVLAVLLVSLLLDARFSERPGTVMGEVEDDDALEDGEVELPL